MKQLDRFFHLTEKGATLAGEVRGGCTTFFSTVGYVLLIFQVVSALLVGMLMSMASVARLELPVPPPSGAVIRLQPKSTRLRKTPALPER